ncbi:MAG: hypothetical protein GHCLOJNM_02730 [bacterium]|nr:hypothetical protein [bacterium]
MVFWFIPEGDGPRLRLIRPWLPTGYVETDSPGSMRRLEAGIRRSRTFQLGEEVLKPDFWTGEARPLRELRVLNMDSAYGDLIGLYRRHPEVSYYNSDIPFEQLYAYIENLFPTAYCRFSHEGEALRECVALESPRDTDYPAMPLRVAKLHGDAYLGGPNPLIRFLALEMGDRTLEWDFSSPEDALRSLNGYLADWDPDLLVTAGGDSILMPCLFSLAARLGIPLELDREPNIHRALDLKGRSYMSYGRIVYRDPDYPLWGRWHIDRRNCFLDHESELDGLIEASRVSRLPVQRMARRSIGTGISSVQMAHVCRKGYAIPWKKSRPEGWKSALQLLKSDRGGLTFQPTPGVYENVIELDFVSMYPSIMTNFNVSPETINCPCCPESSRRVPELGYRICEKRSGLISEALVPILEKRIEYKRRMRAATDPTERKRYKNRQTALKWLLVCCFGYLGYKNARFGRIEAHESICALSREMLLRTRDLCEARGFSVLHSLVDCVWLRRSRQSKEEVEDLCRAIETETNLPIMVEGFYSWLVFFPSTQHGDLPVPARYLGRFEDGSLKYRGIEIRRSDQAPYVQTTQGELLDLLSRADSWAACRRMGKKLRACVAKARKRLERREVPLSELLLKRQLSRSAEEYKGNSMSATAARMAAKVGKRLIGGQDVFFVVTNSNAGNPEERICLLELLRPETNYDVDFYVEQLRRMASNLLDPLLGEEERGERFLFKSLGIKQR